MANTSEQAKRFGDNLAGVVKASERLAIGTEIRKMIGVWSETARQLSLDGAEGLVAHVKLTSKIEAAREVMEMLVARGTSDVAGLSS